MMSHGDMFLLSWDDNLTHKHCIPSVVGNVEPRISLCFRNIAEKVTRVDLDKLIAVSVKRKRAEEEKKRVEVKPPIAGSAEIVTDEPPSKKTAGRQVLVGGRLSLVCYRSKMCFKCNKRVYKCATPSLKGVCFTCFQQTLKQSALSRVAKKEKTTEAIQRCFEMSASVVGYKGE